MNTDTTNAPPIETVEELRKAIERLRVLSDSSGTLVCRDDVLALLARFRPSSASAAAQGTHVIVKCEECNGSGIYSRPIKGNEVEEAECEACGGLGEVPAPPLAAPAESRQG